MLRKISDGRKERERKIEMIEMIEIDGNGDEEGGVEVD